MNNEIAKIVAIVLAAIGGVCAGVWTLLTKFGDRWIEHRFAKRLEILRNEEAKELERLRHQITSLFSRISKIHEKEFEVLPEAFLRLHSAYGPASQMGSALQRTVALNRMSNIHFEEFVEASTLPKFRKEELLQSSNREEYYERWIFWTDLAAAKLRLSEFHNFLVMNRIFMTEQLRQQFTEIDTLLNAALNSLETDREMPGMGLLAQARESLAKIQPLLDPLETAIQKRLHYDEA